MSWIDKLVDKVIRLKKGPTFVVASGITTSGPAHMGTVMEFLIPSTIVQELRRRGYGAEFIFVADIMDAFDSVPAGLRGFKELYDELGKPLDHVHDPYGCHRSYGEHFFNEVLELMEKFGIEVDNAFSATQLYSEGWYDDYLRFFYERIDEVRKILEETSFRKLPKDWLDFVKPICPKCGRIDKTKVTKIVNDQIHLKCLACGYEGYITIESHAWKLVWRLDWPSRQDFLGVDVEGGGVDHFTRGGSWDTAVAVHTKLFGKEPPVGFKFGFVLLEGRKMSKSKGIGALQDLLKILHPMVMKYFLLKHDLEENRNMRLNSRALLRLYDEYKLVSEGRYQDEKQRKAWELSGASRWNASFGELLVYYQLYRDWGLVTEKVGDEKTIKDLKPYVEEWVKRGMVPEEYLVSINPKKPPKELVGVVKEFLNRLSPDMSDVDIHNLVYDVARGLSVEPRSSLRLYT